ncbi:MAG: universal stress protein [Janibacter sp.]
MKRLASIGAAVALPQGESDAVRVLARTKLRQEILMTVLVAGSATAEGAAAYRFGIEEARRRGEDLIYFVLDGEHTPSEQLGDIVERVEHPDERSHSAVGDLLDCVEREEVSAVTVGIRRRTAVAKLILGSQAQQLILEASAPVICVKA